MDPNTRELKVKEVVIHCYLPNKTPEQFHQFLEKLGNALEEHSVMFHFKVDKESFLAFNSRKAIDAGISSPTIGIIKSHP